MADTVLQADDSVKFPSPTVKLQTPLEAMGTVLPTANALVQFQGRQAVGQALQQATDPNGNVDPLQFNRLVAANPLARGAMQEAASQSQQLQGQQQALANSRNGQIMSLFGAALKSTDDQLVPTAAHLLQQAVTMNLIPQQQATQLAMQLPNDPQALRQALTKAQLSLMGPEAQRAATIGTPYDQDRGDVLSSGVRRPMDDGGGLVEGSRVTPGMSPAQRSGSITVPLSGGRQQAITTDEFSRTSGINPTPNAQPNSGIPPMRVAPAAQPKTGLQPSPTQSAPAPSPQNGTGAPYVQQSKAADQAQTASVNAYGQAVQDSTTYNQRTFALERAMDALDTAKTGNGSQFLQNVASRLQTLTPSALEGIMPNIRSEDDIAAFDEGKKYLARLQLQQTGAGRSDQGLATAGAASPSNEISPKAAKLLVRAQLGQDRMQQAMLNEFHSTHPQGTEDQYARWLGTTSPKMDPRAFVADKQTPQERRTVLEGLKGDAKTNYLDSYALAKKFRIGALQ